MSEWRPIETAPKDGTRILVFTENGATALVKWVDAENMFWRVPGEWVAVVDEHYATLDEDESEDGEFCDFWAIDPTHWMPLPEPPDIVAGSMNHLANEKASETVSENRRISEA